MSNNNDDDDENDEIVMAKMRQCLITYSEYGHSDLIDFLADYVRGDESLEMFLWNCNVTYLGSTEPAPL